MDFPDYTENEAETTSIFDDYEKISVGGVPTSLKWSYPSMYKESQTGGTLYWRIGFDGTTDELVTEHGYEITPNGDRGKLQVDRLKLFINNLHKTILSKAVQDASKAYDDKYKMGYSDESGKVINLPLAQLANKYALPGQKGKVTLQKKHFDRGVAIQAKLDGIRARSWLINGEVKVYSREFNEHPWLDLIKVELRMLLAELPPGVGIDGELYNIEFKFQQLTSVVRTFKTKHILNDQLEYYIFDLIVLQTDFETRFKMLQDAYLRVYQKFPHNKIKILPYYIIHDESFIKQYHDEYVRVYAFEGLILRKVLGNYPHKATTKRDIEETWYKPGRNNNLLKVKDFIDEEGTVVDITSGEGREENLAILHIKDIRGNTFPVRPQGSFETRKKWFLNKAKYIGKKYTIRYFELSSDGVPRFPVGVSFRDYE